MGGKLLKAALLAGLIAGTYGRLRRPASLGVSYSRASTKILVIGGGFGGLAAARGLARAFSGSREVGVALIDRHNYTTFWPMVPSVISGNVEARHVASPIRRLLRPMGIEFFEAGVEGVDFETRRVRTDDGDFAYDHLVLALGSRTAFFAPGAEEHAFDLKGLKKAVRVRNHVLDRFEEAEKQGGDHGDDLLTFVFVGGGTTGVEAASDVHDLIFGTFEGDYPSVDFDRVRLVLVNSDDRLLKGVDPALAHAASLRLSSCRIEVIKDTKVKDVRADAVTLSDGQTIPARTIVWAAGTEPSPPVKDLDVTQDHRGRVVVDGFLRVKERLGVYAVGDCVFVADDGPPIPALAQAAEQEGWRAAANLAAEVEGRDPEPFRYRPLGQLVDLGDGSALVDILGVKFGGLVGALVWRGVYFYELGHNLNRVQVLFDWTTDLFFRPNTSKVFEDRDGPSESVGSPVSPTNNDA